MEEMAKKMNRRSFLKLGGAGLAGTALALGACESSEPADGNRTPADARSATASHGASDAVEIHRYESPPMDAVNLYWIETGEGIVMVDAGRFLSQARYALEGIRARTEKPILGILLTHPHTDHYGGLPVFAEAAVGEVPIYASRITQEDMRTDGQGFIEARNELHGNDFPDRGDIPIPNRVVGDGEEIELGGLKIRAAEFPENETLVTTAYHLPEQRALFAGDIVTVDGTPFLADGFSGNWLRQLRTLPGRYPDVRTVYHGHGDPGPLGAIVGAQGGYIEALRGLVGDALAGGGEVGSDETEAIVADIGERYPDREATTSLVLPGLLEAGVDGIAKELRESG